MRITSSMYYKSLYGTNNSKLSDNLFDVNKQIASGLKIQYAKDDVRTFAETMRLDNELATLGQIKMSTQSGYKVSNQTDTVLNEFSTTMSRTRTLLINAANGTHSDASLDAIASELRVVEDHFKNLSNTSINGQFLFSGTAVDTRPISDDGVYHGNDGVMNSFLGSNAQQKYNISGAELFLGEEVLIKREITSNVVINNHSGKYDYATGTDNGKLGDPILVSDTIRDMMGDRDNVVDTVNAKHHFYIRGTKSDGTAFEQQISMRDDEKVDELLTQIGEAFGNTPNLKLVNVSLNKFGEIVVQDKINGSSKLDFHMVGAVDYNIAGADMANVNDAVYGVNAGQIDNIDNGEKNFASIMNGTSANPDLYVREFVKSGYTSASGAATNIEGLVYDRTQFSKDGSTLTSSIPQVLKANNSSTTPLTILEKNAFATGSTKLSDVADLSQGTADTLDGTKFMLNGVDVNNVNYTVEIDLANAGSTFSVDTTNNGIVDTTYNIYNVDGTQATADSMTYQQLMDVINMNITNNLPIANNQTDYNNAIKTSDFNGQTFLSYDGKIQFQEIGTTDTQASMSLYDSNSGDFSNDASVMTFNSNNTLTIRDPKTDFFRELDEMITAVENHKTYPDDSKGNIRSIGIENAITMIDDLQEHITRSHSMVGAQSNALTMSYERTELLEISTMTLRSSTIDTDMAEASLKLTQLSLNYEAMLSTVGRISKLSLVNYL